MDTEREEEGTRRQASSIWSSFSRLALAWKRESMCPSGSKRRHRGQSFCALTYCISGSNPTSVSFQAGP